MIEIKPVGRPPAEWIYKLAELKISPERSVDFPEISKLLKTSEKSVKHFCATHRVKGEYFPARRSICLRFKTEDLKLAARRHLKNYQSKIVKM